MSKATALSSPPESYVVRIYRRDPRRTTRVAGTVEVVANGREQRFRNLRELRDILAHAARPAPAANDPATRTA